MVKVKEPGITFRRLESAAPAHRPPLLNQDSLHFIPAKQGAAFLPPFNLWQMRGRRICFVRPFRRLMFQFDNPVPDIGLFNLYPFRVRMLLGKAL